jgi:hypothetical protein
MSEIQSTLQVEQVNEAWRNVDGWPYQVSNLGRLRRTKGTNGTHAGRILKARPRPRYCIITLRREGQHRDCHVHRLVALAFLGAPESGQQVNHKDGNKENNAVSNLEYVTPDENMQHAVETGLIPRGERCHQALLKRDQVEVIRHRYSKGGITYIELAKEYGVSKSCIGHAVRGKSWK